MAITWIKKFTSLDDGNVLTGAQLGQIQDDVENNTVHLTGAQTIAGDKTFTGAMVMSGTILSVPKISEYVFYEDELVSWENEAVYYA